MPDTSRMRIAMLLHKSVEFDARVRREARALADAGHAVTTVELDPGAHGRLDGFDRVSAAPPAWVRRVLPTRVYRAVFLVGFLVRLLRLRPDVVHAHDAAMLLPGLLGARLTRARLVYDSHELATGVAYRDAPWERFVGALERLAVPRAAAVITVSDAIADRLHSLYELPARPVVVRNATDLPAPGAATGVLRTRLGIGDAPLVLHQGAPAPGRGCEELIDALALVPGAHLVFLGTSPFPGYEDALRERAAGASVHFVPSVPLAELLAHTADADVGVSLLQDVCENHRLALPNKVFEYVAAGVPVVASDLPELSRLIAEHGIGWTTPPADPAAIAAALRTALESGVDAERLRLASDALSWRRERSRLIALYDDLAGVRPDAVLLVRNAVHHDARVLRAAKTLGETGRRPLIVGVAASKEQSAHGIVEGSAVTWLRPGLPFNAALRRVARSRTATVAAPGASAGGPPRSVSPLQRLHRLVVSADLHRRAIRLLLQLRPELVHANDHNTMWIGIAAKLACRSRLIYDAHELWPDRNGRWEWRAWLLLSEWLFVRAADEVVTASPGYAERMAARYRIPRPLVVRNVPDVARTRPIEGEAEGEPIAVYVGGILPGRGLEQAIDALAFAPLARLRIIGPGGAPYVRSLERRAHELEVADRVEFRPPTPPGQVVNTIAGTAVGLNLIQPICESYSLTLPNKLFEYVSAGVPVLTSDVPVSARFVREHGIGEVVGAGDVPAIGDALERMTARNDDRDALAERLAATRDEVNWSKEREILVAAYG